MTERKLAWLKWLVPVFGLLLSLILIEIGVRVLFVKSASVKLRTDRPGVYFYSEQSKNSFDFSYVQSKPKDTYRIVAVGDSFTFGYGNLLDDSYPKRIERILNLNIKQPKVEVLNFGTPGFSTWQEVDLVKKAIQDFHADIVILQITLNDPELKPYEAPRGVLGGKVGEELTRNGILKYWKTLGLVVSRIVNTTSYSGYIKYYQDLFSDAETVDSFNKALADISNISKANKVPVVGLVFPLLSFPFDNRYPFLEAHKTIHESLDRLGIPYLDLLRSLRGLDPIRLQAVPPGLPDADPHPNEIAHRVASEALVRWLGKNGYIPDSINPRCRGNSRKSREGVSCKEN